jgi:serine phosphatase RsbU (regulator of sigma subunit)
MIIVGDVAGRGADAAALTSLSRYTLRTAGRLLGDPVGAVVQLNAALRERAQFSLVTACCALVRPTADAVVADVVLAGHPPAYHVHGRTPRPVGALAPLLGVYDSGGWEATAVRLSPGDRLVLYTDGVIDTVGVAGRFGEWRLADALRDAASADDTVRRIDDALHRFAAGPQVDDTAVLVIERSADGPPAA